MRTRPKITSIEIVQYELTLQDVAPEPTIGIPVYKPGSVMKRRRHAIRIHSDIGVTGVYSGGSPMDYAAIAGFASCLLGRNPLQREDIYNDFKQAMRQQARMGVGVVDIALWDLAGKYHDAPIYELLGGSQKPLPCYASTYLGDYEPGGLSSPEAYADFAEQCLEVGYPAYKIHGWQSAPLKDQIAVVHTVGKRVSGKMDLMLDPFQSRQLTCRRRQRDRDAMLISGESRS
jgi:L-alanine-DL-glutamate epimerase-like enolase superfamily enzyme